MNLQDIQFYSNMYDDLNSLRQTAIKKLQLIEEKLRSKRIEDLANAIDAYEMNSYQYNSKIVGLPQVTEQESAETTTTLCLNLFKAMAVGGIS